MKFLYTPLENVLEIAKKKNEKPFLLALDGVEDPRNFGAILRTAEAAGVHGVIIPKNRSVSLNDTVMKTSTGAAELIPVVQVTNLNQTIDLLKKENIWIVGVEAEGTDRYNKISYANIGILLVLGSEGFGISKLSKEKCDFLVSLPMKGLMTSLNVSVAAGIMMYEINRQKDSAANG
jgi:23S rRNA (guanosine2251-2'-O)-methyltransferase